MRSIFVKLNPPNWYLISCQGVAALGWLPFFFGSPMMHGGTLASITFGWAGLVLGGYCSLELVRASPKPWYKSPALFGCIVYGFLVGGGLYYAVPYIPRLFAA
jgi:hypothetical protein